MGFKAEQDRLIRLELQRRATEFADSYNPSNPSVVLLPGGMGSRLMQLQVAVPPGLQPGEDRRFQKLWLSVHAILSGELFGLRMTRQEHDHGNRPVIAFGEVRSRLAKKYDATEAYFADPAHQANYAVFGYDWRKLPREGASYLREFLSFLHQACAAQGHPDPRPTTTLLAHSMGGLVGKLLLNSLHQHNEQPGNWFFRLVTAGTPFYGTERHLQRYYMGQRLVNLLALKGRPGVADMVWTFPGPYVLTTAPRTVLQPRLAALGLNEYPLRDADTGLAVDPFLQDQRGRFPAFMSSAQSDWSFTSQRFSAAAQESAAVDRQLPDAFSERIFNIRSSQGNPAQPVSFRTLWRNVDGASYDMQDGDNPLSTNGGDSDGTVPFWSARLATLPANQVVDFQGLEHSDLLEQNDVLDCAWSIMQGVNNPQPTAVVAPVLAAPAAVETLLLDVASGVVDIDELANQPVEIQRTFERMMDIS